VPSSGLLQKEQDQKGKHGAAGDAGDSYAWTSHHNVPVELSQVQGREGCWGEESSRGSGALAKGGISGVKQVYLTQDRI